MYYLLIALIFALFLVAMKVFSGELMHPATAGVAIFLFSALEGLLQYKEFQYADFTSFGVFCIMLGLVSYVAFSYVAQVLYKKWEKRKAGKIAEVSQDPTPASSGIVAFRQYKRIDLHIILLIAGLLFIGWCCYATYHYMANFVVQQYGEGEYTLQNIIASFRSMATNSAYETNPPKYLGFSQRIVELCGIFCLFSLAYNLCLCKAGWKDIFYVAGACGWIVLILLQSNRGLFLTILSFLAYLFYYFMKMRNGWKKKVDLIFGVSACVILILFMFFFLRLRILLGRGSAMNRAQNLFYITIYINGGIRDFDIFLRNPTFPTLPGSELFYGVYKSLHVFLHIGDNIVRHLDFVTLNNVGYSNIFTAFRRFYTTGKEAGIIFFAGLQGAIYTIGYLVNRANLKKGRIIFNVILFSYFSTGIFYLPVDDVFYTTFISLGVPARILVMYVIYFLFFRTKLNQPAIETKKIKKI